MNIPSGLFKWAASVIIIWEVFFLLVFGAGDRIETLSKAGDAFNILNALFAGLAFAAICYQLWMQQRQIDEERIDRRRVELISALTIRIQVTFDKIRYERNLLLQVTPGFKNVSFLHEGDGSRTGDAIAAKEGIVLSLQEMITTRECYSTWQATDNHVAEDLKNLWDSKAALPMMKQIKKWVEQLEIYENQIDALLEGVSK